MAARKVDRWWTILIAFAVALGMVLLVMLAMSSGPSDGAAGTVQPATPRTTPAAPIRHHATPAWPR